MEGLAAYHFEGAAKLDIRKLAALRETIRHVGMRLVRVAANAVVRMVG